MTALQNVIYPVSDLAAATTLYSTLLGTAPAFETPGYVQFSVGGIDVGLAPRGGGPDTPVAYWKVDDLDAAVAAVVAAGASVVSEPREVGGGRRIAVVADADGNPVGLLSDAA